MDERLIVTIGVKEILRVVDEHIDAGGEIEILALDDDATDVFIKFLLEEAGRRSALANHVHRLLCIED